MVFYFMGLHGRVIQAYRDGEKLILRKNRLFEFRDFEAAQLTCLFGIWPASRWEIQDNF
jgi:hypothetical protein